MVSFKIWQVLLMMTQTDWIPISVTSRGDRIETGSLRPDFFLLVLRARRHFFLQNEIKIKSFYLFSPTLSTVKSANKNKITNKYCILP